MPRMFARAGIQSIPSNAKVDCRNQGNASKTIQLPIDFDQELLTGWLFDFTAPAPRRIFYMSPISGRL